MWKRILLLASLAYGAHTLTDGFTISKLTSKHSYHLADFGSRQEAELILDQPFHYLTSGGQSFVFVSADSRYVLKFFKGHIQPWTILKKVRERKARKITRTLEGYRLLEEKLPGHSATIYAHLSKTPFRSVRLIDICGISHIVDLSHIECILQHKVEPLSASTSAKVRALASLMAQQKITDTDSRQHKNWGILKDTIVIFDAGRIAPDPEGNFHLSDKYLAWEQSL